MSSYDISLLISILKVDLTQQFDVLYTVSGGQILNGLVIIAG
jgi:hypothetical protein